jgi:arsenate reductase
LGTANLARKRVLFLCAGNSCRSQMAEAIVNSGMAGEWQAVSAGSRPAGFVHPLAVRVLSEIGVEVRGARSKPVSEFRGQPFELVVTVCSGAAEQCPVWLRGA